MPAVPGSGRTPVARTASTMGWAASGSTWSGTSPDRPSTTALTLPWPCPVAPSDPNSSARIPATSPSRPPPARDSANIPAARIGPTVCELDGPMPILNKSKTLIMACCSPLPVAGPECPTGRTGPAGWPSRE